jgi:hypothetical protein
MFLRPARAAGSLQLRRPDYACCLASQLSGCQGTRVWAYRVERGYTGPPMSANQLSSGRDRNQPFHLKARCLKAGVVV